MLRPVRVTLTRRAMLCYKRVLRTPQPQHNPRISLSSPPRPRSLCTPHLVPPSSSTSPPHPVHPPLPTCSLPPRELRSTSLSLPCRTQRSTRSPVRPDRVLPEWRRQPGRAGCRDVGCRATDKGGGSAISTGRAIEVALVSCATNWFYPMKRKISCDR